MLLLRAFAEQGFVLPLPTAGHAKAFRMKLYAYFRALRKARQRHDLIDMADSLLVRAEGSELHLVPRSDTKEAVTIREALGVTKSDLPPVSPTAHSLLTAKLAELRAKRAQTT